MIIMLNLQPMCGIGEAYYPEWNVFIALSSHLPCTTFQA